MADPITTQQAIDPITGKPVTAAPKTTGIINNAMAPAQIVSGTVASNTPSATSYGVTKDMTVEGRLQGVMDENGPLMQQAKTSAAQASAERGLTNSSMAVTAGQDSMYRTAVPIAAADAAMFGKAASDNAGNATSMSNANTSASATLGAASIGANASMSNAKTAADSQKYSTDTNNATTISTNKLNNETSLLTSREGNATSRENTAATNATSVANNTASNQTSRENTASTNQTSKENTAANVAGTRALNMDHQAFQTLTAGSTAATSLITSLGTKLSAIDSDINFTDPVAKQTMKTNLVNTAKAGMRLIGAAAGNVDFTKYITDLFPDTP